MGNHPEKLAREDIEWQKLSREQKDLYITVLWNDACSDQAIADFLKATKGKVVGHRHRYLPELIFRDPSIVVKTEVDLQRFGDLLDLEQMTEVEKQGAVVFGPVTHDHDLLTGEIAGASEMKETLPKVREVESPRFIAEVVEPTCEWPSARGVPCGKDVVPGHKLCKEHLRLVPRRP